MKDEALKLALEALKQYTNVVTSVNDPNSWETVGDGGKPARDAITAIKQALAAPVQEPVAYIHRQGNHYEVSERFLSDDEKSRGWTEEPLYTFPPAQQESSEWQKIECPICGDMAIATDIPPAQRKWFGLTDEEIAMAWPYELGQLEKQFALNLEAKLRSKNT
jgi:hypothetical protein